MSASTPVRARLALGLLVVVLLLSAYGARPAALALLAGAAVTGVGAAQESAPARRVWLRLALIAAEAALVLLALFEVPALAGLPPVPHAMFFHSPAVLLFFALIAIQTLGERPLATWGMGVMTVAGWGIAGLATRAESATLTKAQVLDGDFDTLADYLGAVMQPRYLSLDALTLQLCTLAGVTVILGLAAWRARSLAREAAERQAALISLSAHFAGAMAETLLSERFDRPERGELAVLDCDLAGFSARAQRMTPEAVAAALRTFHAFVEERVFAADGAVLKFVGDGVIAVFGLTGGGDAAARALGCAERLAADWPEAGTQPFGGSAPPIAIGVDHGEAAAGIVGEGRALTLIVTGPVVDGAARLQAGRGEGVAAVRASPAALAAAHISPG